MFACPEVGCNQNFSTDRGLTIHRHNCTFAEEGIGVDEALKKLEEKRARKRQKIHQLEEHDFPMFVEPILGNHTLLSDSVSNSYCFVYFLILR